MARTSCVVQSCAQARPSRIAVSILTLVMLVCALPGLAEPAATILGDPQRQSAADMERVGTAIFSWWVNQVGGESEGALRATVLDPTAVPAISQQDLAALLVPTYIDSIPVNDGWGNAYDYRLDQVDLLIAPLAAIRSAGADGAFEGSVYTAGTISDADQDLVWMDGVFVRRLPPLPGDEQAFAAADIQAVGTAFASWVVDQVGRSGSRVIDSCPFLSYDITNVPVISQEDLEDLLVTPGYILFLPDQDGWGNPYEFRLDPMSLLGMDLFSMRSAGSDGAFEGDVYSGGDVTDPAEDLVWVNFSFLRGLPVPSGAEQVVALSEMRSLGTAIFSWIIDELTRLEAPGGSRGGSFDLSLFEPISRQDLSDLLTPLYINCVPETDPWGHAYEYWLNLSNLLGSQLTAIRSSGADGLASGSAYVPGPFPVADTDQDLVWADGFFVRFPDPDWILDGSFESGDFSQWDLMIP